MAEGFKSLGPRLECTLSFGEYYQLHQIDMAGVSIDQK
jgi:hypothetical protein